MVQWLVKFDTVYSAIKHKILKIMCKKSKT